MKGEVSLTDKTAEPVREYEILDEIVQSLDDSEKTVEAVLEKLARQKIAMR